MGLLTSASFVILYFLNLLFVVTAQYAPCQTPNLGSPGSCKPIVDCESLYNIAIKTEQTTAEIDYLRKSLCGVTNNNPIVCCPDAYDQREIENIPLNQCQTPSGAVGDCLRIEECNDLYTLALQDDITDEEIAFLRKSRCGTDVNSKNVCCPKLKVYEPVVETPKINVDGSEIPVTQTCQTPDGLPGECTGMDNCNALSHLFQKEQLTEEELTFLRRSECEVGEFQICCPNSKAKVDVQHENATVATFGPCVTANVKDGECMPIQSCSLMLNLAQNPNMTQEDTIFLQSNQCGYVNKNPLVCCPKLQTSSEPPHVEPTPTEPTSTVPTPTVPTPTVPTPTQQTPTETTPTATTPTMPTSTVPTPTEPTNTEPTTIAATVLSSEECQTPNGTLGECMAIENCNSLAKMYQRENLTEEDLKFLEDSECETINMDEVRVCCPKTVQEVEEEPIITTPTAAPILDKCQTPNGATGTCISLIQCNSLMDILKNALFLDNDMKYLRASFCADSEQFPVVCCADTVGEAILPLPPYCGRVSITNDTDEMDTTTDIDEYPWTALLIYTNARGQNSFRCGGTLIHERYVLTSAHCLQNDAKINNLTGVRFGEWATQVDTDCQSKDKDLELCAPPPLDVAVEKFIVHPEYNSVYNDIALLRLAEVVHSTRFISPICLPFGSNNFANTLEGTTTSIAGWGATKTSQIRSFKMKSIVTVRNLTACISQYSSNAAVNLTERHLCAAGGNAADSVICDSGGALMSLQEIGKVQSYFLVGVDSLIYEYSLSKGFPGVYTQIGAYMEWIKKEIGSN